ncbi:ankyrin repeat-containing domain protein [Hypoxylon argillaceum]|nr:ankyrin repeat-containing domain protein [Hypoxylon argillaceum]
MKTTPLEIAVESVKEHGQDIGAYIGETLLTEDNLIKCQVRERADGIFMWAVLVVAMLNKAYDEGRNSYKAMQTTLEEVPSTLEGVFSSLLGKSVSDRAELVRMLQWVLFSQRPLSPKELYIAAVGNSLPFSRGAIQRRIIGSSKGLIEIRETTKKNEYTLDPTLEPDAISASHNRLWAYCWSYFACQDTASLGGGHMIELHSQFRDYATDYALSHANEALSMDKSDTGPTAQWLEAPGAWAEWRESIGRREYKLDCMGPKNDAVLISIFVSRSYHNLVKLALENNVDVNAQGGKYGNSLQTAAASLSEGYETARLLLEHGAHINAQGGRYGNALQAASLSGSYYTAKLLLENGADVNAQGGYYGNALQAAAVSENKNITQLLLEYGADVNVQGGEYGNALQAAAAYNNNELIQLFVKAGADVNAPGGYYGNALQAAVISKNESITRLLFKNGANIHTQSGNLLEAAVVFKNESMTRLLLENGADVNAPCGYYSNALQAAVISGNESITRLLLESGADIIALKVAGVSQSESMTRLLLENGADIKQLSEEEVTE